MHTFAVTVLTTLPNLHSEPGWDFCILQSHQAHFYKWHLVGLLLCSLSILINTVAGWIYLVVPIYTSSAGVQQGLFKKAIYIH